MSAAPCVSVGKGALREIPTHCYGVAVRSPARTGRAWIIHYHTSVPPTPPPAIGPRAPDAAPNYGSSVSFCQARGAAGGGGGGGGGGRGARGAPGGAAAAAGPPGARGGQ